MGLITKIRRKYYDLIRVSSRDKFKQQDEYVVNSNIEKAEIERILVIGIYLTDFENQAITISSQLSKSTQYIVDQKWFAIGESNIPVEMEGLTIGHSKTKIPKFELLNKLLSTIQLDDYDLLIVTDDDIHILDNFIDVYVSLINKYDLKLAQPARTKYSYYDHKICLQMKNVIARETNFVEIGPIFSIDKSLFDLLLPFPSECPMGYGLDYVWPVMVHKNDMKLGIVDATPVDHSYRPQGKTYGANLNLKLMEGYLSKVENTLNSSKLNVKLFD